MADREILQRIDQHMARGNDLHRELIELSRGQGQVLQAQGELLMSQGTLLTAQTEHLVSLRGETRAQTLALFHVLDRLIRLDPGGSGAEG
jgi:hypothetical protein